MNNNDKYKFLAEQMLEILRLVQKELFLQDYHHSCDIYDRLNKFIRELEETKE